MNYYFVICKNIAKEFSRITEEKTMKYGINGTYVAFRYLLINGDYIIKISLSNFKYFCYYNENVDCNLTLTFLKSIICCILNDYNLQKYFILIHWGGEGWVQKTEEANNYCKDSNIVFRYFTSQDPSCGYTTICSADEKEYISLLKNKFDIKSENDVHEFVTKRKYITNINNVFSLRIDQGKISIDKNNEVYIQFKQIYKIYKSDIDKIANIEDNDELKISFKSGKGIEDLRNFLYTIIK